jgi:hypothetical protein
MQEPLLCAVAVGQPCDEPALRDSVSS